ncbi:MAG: outer membrane protein assembly factor BamD [Planctomycetes bacterium]|nr:outer membrane protein assembly factor BamD [Planctomycetota bacterium]
MTKRLLSPRLGTFRVHVKLAALLAAVVCGCLVPTPPVRAQWPWSKEAPVGTPEWWKQHKNDRIFDPEKGYMVEGVEGYFDGDGRPIQGPVAAERVIEAGEAKEETGLIPGLDPRVQYEKMKTAVGLGPNEQFAREAFAAGDRLFREEKYRAAAAKFKEAIERGPHSTVEQDARFMLAESYFFDDRYVKARDAYDELVKEHPNTRYLDRVIYQEWLIARYWELEAKHNTDWPLTPNFFDKTRPWFDTVGHSIKTYDNIRLNDPTGPRADDAIIATANNYFERERYEDADYHYSLLRSQYPQSELQYEAHLLGLQSKLRKYQGEDYDGTPLEEAKKLVKQLSMQFGGRLTSEEKERLRTVEGQLNMELATRDYRMAEHYDGTKHYGAAKHYYNQVMEKHPGSELATKARDRVAQIAGEPDKPAKPLGAIVELFPQSTERARVARIPELQKGGRLAEGPSSATTR